MVPFSVTFNDPQTKFQITSLFNVEYFRNGSKYARRDIVTIGTHPIFNSVVLHDLQQLCKIFNDHGESRDLSATCKCRISHGM